MNTLRRFFTETKISWPLVIILSVACGVVPGLLMVPACLQGTSLQEPGVSFEFWIFMGMFIALNCEKPLDAGFKVFVFFLISQPLIYLVQVPFASLGWQLFGYYPLWGVITIFTFPAGMLVSLIRRDKWWGVIIVLLPMAILACELGEVPRNIADFPKMSLTTLFILAQLVLWPLITLKGKKRLAITYVVAVLLFAASFAWSLYSDSMRISDSMAAEGQAPYTLISKGTDELDVTIENGSITVSFSSLNKNDAYTLPIKYKDATGKVYSLTFIKTAEDSGTFATSK